jgi:hypothetical protein
MINRLIKIANILDKQGYEEDADFVTGLLVEYKKAQLGSIDGLDKKAYSDSEIDIPEDELALLRQVFSALGDSLGESENGDKK